MKFFPTFLKIRILWSIGSLFKAMLYEKCGTFMILKVTITNIECKYCTYFSGSYEIPLHLQVNRKQEGRK